MASALALLAKNWYWAVILVLLAVLGGFRIALDRAHAETLRYQVTLNATAAAARAELDREIASTTAVQVQYEQSKKAISLLSDAIHDSVLDYETRLRAAAAAATAGRANGAPGIVAGPAGAHETAPSQPKPASAADTTPELIAGTLGACYRDVERFVALQDWIRALTTQETTYDHAKP